MRDRYFQIIDANMCRVSEGLRVIEDYTRFISNNIEYTHNLAYFRKQLHSNENDSVSELVKRNNKLDVRAKEIPKKREDIIDLLKANFKRIEEGLRVLEEFTGNSKYNAMRYDIYELEKEIILSTMKKKLAPGVYLISDDIKILEQGLLWNVSAIQLRDKHSSKHQILQKALRIQKKAKKAGIPLIINDYIDIAITCNADGFHSGQDDLAIQHLRNILGPHKIIGRSTQTLKEGIDAQKQGADYIGIGPIWKTASKEERNPIGLSYLKKAGEHITIPYVAIGDITLAHMAEISDFKPQVVALIRAYKEIPQILKKYYSSG